MTGRIAALVLALVFSPAQLRAQDTVFRIGVPSADVHKGPSVVTPVIGHVSQGTVVPVVRDLGSWVRIEWPGGLDGFGYLHVTTGRLTPRSGDESIAKPTPRASGTAAAAPFSVPPSSPSSSMPAASSGATAMTPRPHPARERVVVRSQQGGTAISHVFGVGGLFGSMDSFGATARAWRDDRFGLQFGFTRDQMTSSVAAGHVTSMQVEPAVVYGLFDRVSDYVWIRPYVGSGVSIRQQTLHDATPAGGDTTSTTGAGFRIFGGSEFTFAGAPRFGLSVDAGYRRFSTSFPGFDSARFSVFLSGHWYVK